MLTAKSPNPCVSHTFVCEVVWEVHFTESSHNGVKWAAERVCHYHRFSALVKESTVGSPLQSCSFGSEARGRLFIMTPSNVSRLVSASQSHFLLSVRPRGQKCAKLCMRSYVVKRAVRRATPTPLRQLVQDLFIRCA